MDYCLLEDAYKGSSEISNNTSGCTDNIASSKQQKHEKRKKQRKQDCFNPQAVDPQDSKIINRPASEPKNYSEAFQNISVKLPTIPSKLGGNLPSYFLGGGDDEIEGFVSDFEKESEKGFEKVSGGSNQLPIPSVNDYWKPLTPSTNNTAYFTSLPTPGGTYPIWNDPVINQKTVNKADTAIINAATTKSATNTAVDPNVDHISNTSELQLKINNLMNRLDALEKHYNTPHLNNQQEILAFVGTGVFMIFTLSILRC